MAAQVDLAEAGKLLLFVDESQVAFLEDMMWDQGYLDRPQMARTLSTIRSEDLIWGRAVRRYLLGQDDLPTDLPIWSADTTRSRTMKCSGAAGVATLGQVQLEVAETQSAVLPLVP